MHIFTDKKKMPNRQYDPALARWHVTDAVSEKYMSSSPYAYVMNNPINAADFLGLQKVPLPPPPQINFTTGGFWDQLGNLSGTWGDIHHGSGGSSINNENERSNGSPYRYDGVNYYDEDGFVVSYTQVLQWIRNTGTELHFAWIKQELNEGSGRIVDGIFQVDAVNVHEVLVWYERPNSKGYLGNNTTPFTRTNDYDVTGGNGNSPGWDVNLKINLDPKLMSGIPIIGLKDRNGVFVPHAKHREPSLNWAELQVLLIMAVLWTFCI